MSSEMNSGVVRLHYFLAIDAQEAHGEAHDRVEHEA